jgi:hypothetical protein
MGTFPLIVLMVTQEEVNAGKAAAAAAKALFFKNVRLLSMGVSPFLNTYYQVYKLLIFRLFRSYLNKIYFTTNRLFFAQNFTTFLFLNISANHFFKHNARHHRWASGE